MRTFSFPVTRLDFTGDPLILDSAAPSTLSIGFARNADVVTPTEIASIEGSLIVDLSNAGIVSIEENGTDLLAPAEDGDVLAFFSTSDVTWSEGTTRILQYIQAPTDAAGTVLTSYLFAVSGPDLPDFQTTQEFLFWDRFNATFIQPPDDGPLGPTLRFAFSVIPGVEISPALDARATDGPDRIGGLLGDDRLDGRGGDDAIDGGGGEDTLIGGAGDDILEGGFGADLLSGGDGDDRLIGDDGSFEVFDGADTLLGGAGRDTLTGLGDDDLLRGGADDDDLQGGAGADTLLGDAGADNLDGEGGADRLDGGPGGDTLRGGGGGDTLRGEAGDDLLLGEAGADVLSGGDGGDTLRGGDGDDDLAGGAGADVLFGDVGNDTLRGDGDDILVGGMGGDVYIVEPGAEVREAADGSGIDELRTKVDYALTAPGIERLVAVGAGDVRLDGTAGDETLVGNAGRNILVGWGGADSMTGGAAADTFVLIGSAGLDPQVTIGDWGDGADRLAIDDRLLGIGDPGVDVRALTPEIFRDLRDGGGVAYDRRSGELRLDIDGDGALDRVATIEGGARLGLDDILLF